MYQKSALIFNGCMAIFIWIIVSAFVPLIRYNGADRFSRYRDNSTNKKTHTNNVTDTFEYEMSHRMSSRGTGLRDDKIGYNKERNVENMYTGFKPVFSSFLLFANSEVNHGDFQVENDDTEQPSPSVYEEGMYEVEEIGRDDESGNYYAKTSKSCSSEVGESDELLCRNGSQTVKRGLSVLMELRRPVHKPSNDGLEGVSALLGSSNHILQPRPTTGPFKDSFATWEQYLDEREENYCSTNLTDSHGSQLGENILYLIQGKRTEPRISSVIDGSMPYYDYIISTPYPLYFMLTGVFCLIVVGALICSAFECCRRCWYNFTCGNCCRQRFEKPIHQYSRYEKIIVFGMFFVFFMTLTVSMTVTIAFAGITSPLIQEEFQGLICYPFLATNDLVFGSEIIDEEELQEFIDDVNETTKEIHDKFLEESEDKSIVPLWGKITLPPQAIEYIAKSRWRGFDATFDTLKKIDSLTSDRSLLWDQVFIHFTDSVSVFRKISALFLYKVTWFRTTMDRLSNVLPVSTKSYASIYKDELGIQALTTRYYFRRAISFLNSSMKVADEIIAEIRKTMEQSRTRVMDLANGIDGITTYVYGLVPLLDVSVDHLGHFLITFCVIAGLPAVLMLMVISVVLWYFKYYSEIPFTPTTKLCKRIAGLNVILFVAMASLGFILGGLVLYLAVAADDVCHYTQSYLLQGHKTHTIEKFSEDIDWVLNLINASLAPNKPVLGTALQAQVEELTVKVRELMGTVVKKPERFRPDESILNAALVSSWLLVSDFTQSSVGVSSILKDDYSVFDNNGEKVIPGMETFLGEMNQLLTRHICVKDLAGCGRDSLEIPAEGQNIDIGILKGLVRGDIPEEDQQKADDYFQHLVAKHNLAKAKNLPCPDSTKFPSGTNCTHKDYEELILSQAKDTIVSETAKEVMLLNKTLERLNNLFFSTIAKNLAEIEELVVNLVTMVDGTFLFQHLRNSVDVFCSSIIPLGAYYGGCWIVFSFLCLIATPLAFMIWRHFVCTQRIQLIKYRMNPYQRITQRKSFLGFARKVDVGEVSENLKGSMGRIENSTIRPHMMQTLNLPSRDATFEDSGLWMDGSKRQRGQTILRHAAANMRTVKRDKDGFVIDDDDVQERQEIDENQHSDENSSTISRDESLIREKIKPGLVSEIAAYFMSSPGKNI